MESKKKVCPKKILHIGVGNHLGGIETFTINYFRKLDKKRYMFDFININDENLFFNDELIKGGSTIYHISSYYRHPIKYIIELKKIINENNYSIVHCNMNSAAMIFPLIACKLSNAKIIIAHAHNSSSDKGIMKSILHTINKHFIPLLANKYVTCSEKAGEWFYSKKIRTGNKYYVINNSIDIDKFKYDGKKRKEIRKKLNINDETILIGHVARFFVQKNHKFIVEIAKELKKRKNNFKILLIGEGPLMDDIKKMVEDNNLTKEIIFLGQRLDVNEIMNAMDIFILPSLYEGLPIVAVEAQGNGLYCLLSDTITKEVVDTENVEFISIEDEKLWVDKIASFQTENYNRNVILNKYNIENSIETLYKLYSDDNV